MPAKTCILYFPNLAALPPCDTSCFHAHHESYISKISTASRCAWFRRDWSTRALQGRGAEGTQDPSFAPDVARHANSTNVVTRLQTKQISGTAARPVHRPPVALFGTPRLMHSRGPRTKAGVRNSLAKLSTDVPQSALGQTKRSCSNVDCARTQLLPKLRCEIILAGAPGFTE